METERVRRRRRERERETERESGIEKQMRERVSKKFHLYHGVLDARANLTLIKYRQVAA